MYEKFYGFTSKPFQLTPDPSSLYLSAKHENALTYLEYVLRERSGFILLTGEIGAGKTTLVRYLLNMLEPSVRTAVILNSNVTPDQLLTMILSEFEVVPSGPDKAVAFEALNRFLIARNAQGGYSLLIIDEAQNLALETLEEVRRLSSLQIDDQHLLQIMLVGQPELRVRLKRPELAQLSQCNGVSYHIPHLTLDETAAYIAFRLEKAGGKPDIFTPAAMQRIYRASRGVPRAINILCDAALVYGFADKMAIIDAPVVEQAIEDREGRDLLPAAPLSAESPSTAGADAGGQSNEFLSRLDDLERSLHMIQQQMDWHIEDLEGKGQGFKDDLVRNMKELYDRERDRTDKLLFEYSRIKERCAMLVKEKDAKAQAASSAENADLIGRMRDMLNAEREKNRQLEEAYKQLKEAFRCLEQNRLSELDRENQEFIANTFMDKQRNGKNRSWLK